MVQLEKLNCESTQKMTNEKSSEERDYSFKQWIKHCKDTYGVSILSLIILSNLIKGFSVLFVLTWRDLFKLYLGLEPVESQYFSAIIALTFSFKLFIGIFIDNVKMCTSNKNFYLKVSGIVMWMWLILIQIGAFQSKYCILVLLFMYNLFGALSGVVSDVIMVIYARRDPEHGSSDLQSINSISFSAGGIFGSVIKKL